MTQTEVNKAKSNSGDLTWSLESPFPTTNLTHPGQELDHMLLSPRYRKTSLNSRARFCGEPHTVKGQTYMYIKYGMLPVVSTNMAKTVS